jgi:glycosyltransferase involved in cell wall biosynthesis
MSQRRPLRVAQVVRPATGGIRSHVRTLLGHLDLARFTCTVYGPGGLNLQLENAVHVPLDIRRRMHPIADLRAIGRLARLLRGNTDLVHAHGLRGALIGIPAAHLARVPAVFTAHNLAPRLSAPQRFILADLTRRAARVIAVSHAVAETLTGLGVQGSRVAVIPNGIDLAALERQQTAEPVRPRFDIAPQAPLIVAVGRLAREKGFDLLIDAMWQLTTGQAADVPDAVLMIVGSGPEEGPLRASASGLNVRFMGRVEQVMPLLQAADVVAIPSREEGQGIVALEAMAARRAIVAGRVGGLTETLEDGACGLLVAPNDVQELVRGLDRLLADAGLRQKLGQAGRARVEREYTAERMIERTSALYEAVCGDFRF